jgi:hypothetical protein
MLKPCEPIIAHSLQVLEALLELVVVEDHQLINGVKQVQVEELLLQLTGHPQLLRNLWTSDFYNLKILLTDTLYNLFDMTVKL